MKNNYLVQAWLVLGLSLLFGAALAGVDGALADKIKTNKINETMGQIPSLVPGATGGEKAELDGQEVYRAVDAQGRQVGWLVPAAGQGFADRIEILIGLSPSADKITGIYVLSNKETPGLGNKIDDVRWTGQFAGKSAAGPLVVRKAKTTDENAIQAITGATISSEAVTGIVNSTVAALRNTLAAAARK